MMIRPPDPDARAHKRLLALFDRLPEDDRATLVAFAEFLVARLPAAAPSAPEPPRLLPRPPGESVVAAIRRLSASYPMLDRTRLLNVGSSLMTQHILQGRAAAEVIDELEGVFAAEYAKLVAGASAGDGSASGPGGEG
jgi:hypothetical protein